MIGRICCLILLVLVIGAINTYFFSRYGDDGTEDCRTVAMIYCMLNAIVISMMVANILISKGLI